MKSIVDYFLQIYVEIKYTQKMSHVTVSDISTGVLILWELAHLKLLSVFVCDQIFKYFYFMSGADFTIGFQSALIQLCDTPRSKLLERPISLHYVDCSLTHAIKS